MIFMDNILYFFPSGFLISFLLYKVLERASIAKFQQSFITFWFSVTFVYILICRLDFQYRTNKNRPKESKGKEIERASLFAAMAIHFNAALVAVLYLFVFLIFAFGVFSSFPIQ